MKWEQMEIASNKMLDDMLELRKWLEEWNITPDIYDYKKEELIKEYHKKLIEILSQ